jgi:midasin
LLEQPGLSGGPLAFVLSATPVSDLDTGRLHRILLAYYRILSANRNLPAQLAWPLDPLRALFHAPHPDAGVRFLAIRCYALQSFMLEANREKLEAEFVGQVHEVDCPIRYLEAPDGQVKEIDGWLLALTESRRNVAARNAVVEEDNDYYLIEAGEPQERIHDSQLR